MEQPDSTTGFEDLSEQVRVRFEKLGRYKERGENPFKNGFKPEGLARDLHLKYDEKTKVELEPAAISGLLQRPGLDH